MVTVASGHWYLWLLVVGHLCIMVNNDVGHLCIMVNNDVGQFCVWSLFVLITGGVGGH